MHPHALRVAAIGTSIAQRDGRWATHHSFGRILLKLAERVGTLHYHAPQATGHVAEMCDYALDHPRLVVHAMPARRNAAQALRRPDLLVREYWAMATHADAVFLRGVHPLIWLADWFALARGRRVLHWFVADSAALLASGDRGYRGWRLRAALAFVAAERALTALSMRAAGARVLANGAAIADLYPSRRTSTVVSTSIGVEDFHHRADTCTGAELRVLFVGFVRPEKGIEYLLRALPLVRAGKPVRLAIVGGWGQHPFERERLCRIIAELGLAERVTWEGYAEFGPALFAHMDRADLLALPTLSEGTPRVLVEARARSLPIVATNVGGIPSSVRDGEDGLLVPPRDAAALALAISRIATDAPLRRALMEHGRERVRAWTVDHFVDQVLAALTAPPDGLRECD